MTADTPSRCEPPPELRSVDGLYWVCGRSGLTMPAHWYASPRDGIEPLWRNLFTQQTGTPAWAAAEWGWRYLAPVATPAEVEALRAERDDAVKMAAEHSESTDLLASALLRISTLRARVVRLEELVRSAYAEGWVDGSNGKYDTAADAWEWASARAALSAETP